jgi:inner membrane protein
LEPVTHFLFGACLGRAGFNRKTALATATMTLAAEAPDLDVFARFAGPAAGLEHHRGFTHSFLGGVLVAVVVVAFMYGVWRMRGRKTKSSLPPRWGLLFVLAYLAVLTHILLDFTNNYGVRPFWPLSEKWYSWDIVFVIEPVMLVLLLAGLVLPALGSLISEEIGARRKGPKGRLAAILALAAVVLMWAVRDYEHRRALIALNARTYEGVDAIRVSAFPYMGNPFHWYAVAETESSFATMEVDSLTPDVDPQGRMRVFYKPQETPATLAAKASYMGRVYLDWAAYPVVESEQLSQGWIVHFKDLRYDYPGRRRPPLSAEVELDTNLRVTGEFMGPRGSR